VLDIIPGEFIKLNTPAITGIAEVAIPKVMICATLRDSAVDDGEFNVGNS
jgi:hypothetical protein